MKPSRRFTGEETPLASLVREVAGGMRLIPGHLELSKIDALYGKKHQHRIALARRPAGKSGMGGQPILIDCCPMLGVLSLNAIFCCRSVLIPVSADFLFHAGGGAAGCSIERSAKRAEAQQSNARWLVTRFDSRITIFPSRFRELKGALRRRLVRNPHLGKRQSGGKPGAWQDVFDFCAPPRGKRLFCADSELLEKGFIQ